MKSWILILAILLPPLAANARSSNACFTPDEVTMMVLKRDAVSKGAADCLRNYWNTHNQFFKQNRYSKYFGNRSKSLDTADKRALTILFILWPNILTRSEVQRFHGAFQAETLKRNPNAKSEDLNAGLSDFEKYIQTSNPGLYRDYIARKPSLNLEARARSEDGQDKGKRGSDLRGNTTLPVQNISCVDMTRRCLREGFKQAGMESTFEKVDYETRATDLSGVEMQKALGDLGWKILYWNPDPSQDSAWDADDQKILPLRLPEPCNPPQPCKKAMVWQGAWGGHAGRYKRVMDKDEYFLGGERPLLIDDKRLLVGFGTSVPAEFKAVPFWVGTAHSGYHVFPGFSGNIIEAHSTRPLNSIDNLQVSSFNPLDQDNRGGPRWTNSEKYRSGVIAVPPGYLDPVGALHAPQIDDKGCVDLHPSRAPASVPASSTGATIKPALPGNAASTISH